MPLQRIFILRNFLVTRMIRAILCTISNNVEGNFGITLAILMPMLIVAAGGAVDMARALAERDTIQVMLDGGVLSAAKMTDPAAQQVEVQNFLMALTTNGSGLTASEVTSGLTLSQNADGSLTGRFQENFKTMFLPVAGLNQFPVAASSTALVVAPVAAAAATPCIYVLANKNQALLVNSGANVIAPACEIEVDSVSNPAFIMNSGAAVSSAKFCVKGTQYINNGGNITHFAAGCSVDPDPYAGTLPEPVVSSTCTTSGALNGTSYTIQPGVQCGTIFNGSPTLTFAPGLHIIKGTMIINANATVIANGVTFYFPDSSSKIQFNGGISMTASAPTNGIYKGLLMFEKSSDPTNNANKQPFVFNGTKGEQLQGIIYLPNRDVTYNSTNNASSSLSLVVNTMIMDSVNWSIQPYNAASGASGIASASGPRLIY